MEEVRGYKVFNPDWTCRGFQYEVGKSYEEDIIPMCCVRGFHFCKRVDECFNYYDFNSDNKVAEVIAYGDIDKDFSTAKYCTNKIKIVREITWPELLEIANIGENCNGVGNIDDNNYGHYNTNNNNNGTSNSGSFNEGNRNSGSYNMGNNNSGWNNYGRDNSGWGNCGDSNSGNYNVGYSNSGKLNVGDYNSGSFNICNYSSGLFCTETPKLIMFNKPTDITYYEWISTEAYKILCGISLCPTKWIPIEDLVEIAPNPEHKTTNGALFANSTSRLSVYKN
jgi:hypothetical protein